MLKILNIILLLLVTSFCFSQNVDFINQPFRYRHKMLKNDSAFILPAYNGLFTTFTNIDSLGAMWYNTGDNKIYMKSTTISRPIASELFVTSYAAPITGSTNYIQNQTTLQTGDFNISGTARIGGFVNIGSNAAPSSPFTITSTTANQLTSGYDGSNKWTASTGSTGLTQLTAAGSSAGFQFNQPAYFNGNLTTSSSGMSIANFSSYGLGAGTANISTAGLLFGGASHVAVKTWFNGTTSTVATANDNIANVIFGAGGWTTAASGYHQYITNVAIVRSAITIGTAQNRYGALLTIDDSTNTAQFNNALIIKSGALRTFGRIIFGLTGLGDPNDSVLVKGGGDSVARVVSSKSWIQNTTSAQTANFNITGNGTIGGNLIVTGTTIMNGGVYASIRTTTTTGAITVNDYAVLANNSSNIVLTLPTAASAAKQTVIIKKISNNANTVTIQANGAELIDGANTQLIVTYNSSLTMQSDGTSWYIH